MFESNRSTHFAIRRKVLLGFGVALLTIALVGMFSFRISQSLWQTLQDAAHTRMVIEKQSQLLGYLLEVESGARGYAASGSENFLRLFERSQNGVVSSYNALKKLVSNDAKQGERLAQVKPLIRQKLEFLKLGVDIRLTGDPAAVAQHFSASSDMELMDQIRAVMADFQKHEQGLLDERTRRSQDFSSAASHILGVAASLCFLLLFVAGWMTLRDIKVRRLSEERLSIERSLLSSVMDAIPDIILVKDRAGHCVVNNRAHREILNLQGVSEMEGRSSYDFFPESLAQQFREEDKFVVETGIPILNRERGHTDEDGKLLWFSTTKVPLRSGPGGIDGVVCVTTDITERKEAEDELRLTAAQLARSNRELQDFASVASHDLQEPLRKILAFSDRLRIKCGDGLGENGRDYLERVMNAARRMQTLIQDLLTLAQVTSRAQPFALVDLHKTVNEVLSDMEVRIEQNSARIEVGRMPAIHADALQMRQLFQNLLSNALKFQRPGVPPEVSIAARMMPLTGPPISGAMTGDEVCQIVVADNGIGFEPRFAERIFQVFQRLHGRNEYEGTGIGLALVRKIIDRHGGQITAKSTPDMGATFIVTLPARQRMRETPDETR